MASCGHDLHTAGLIGAVKLLCAQKEHLLGDVTFMFQPGEEGPGGACYAKYPDARGQAPFDNAEVMDQVVFAGVDTAYPRSWKRCRW